MRSRHCDRFNGDRSAERYDDEVVDESNPARAGYRAGLDWAADRARLRGVERVVDLGAGTGNLAARVGQARQLTCIDISARMLDRARARLGASASYVQADLLEFVAGMEPGAAPDVVLSSYALHHLTGGEKASLLSILAERMLPGGRLAFVDLMLASPSAIDRVSARVGADALNALLEKEFPWYVDEAVAEVGRLGYVDVEVAQLSGMTWGLAATVGG